jgi:hypothetical protein
MIPSNSTGAIRATLIKPNPNGIDEAAVVRSVFVVSIPFRMGVLFAIDNASWFAWIGWPLFVLTSICAGVVFVRQKPTWIVPILVISFAFLTAFSYLVLTQFIGTFWKGLLPWSDFAQTLLGRTGSILLVDCVPVGLGFAVGTLITKSFTELMEIAPTSSIPDFIPSDRMNLKYHVRCDEKLIANILQFLFDHPTSGPQGSGVLDRQWAIVSKYGDLSIYENKILSELGVDSSTRANLQIQGARLVENAELIEQDDELELVRLYPDDDTKYDLWILLDSGHPSHIKTDDEQLYLMLREWVGKTSGPGS